MVYIINLFASLINSRTFKLIAGLITVAIIILMVYSQTANAFVRQGNTVTSGNETRNLSKQIINVSNQFIQLIKTNQPLK